MGQEGAWLCVTQPWLAHSLQILPQFWRCRRTAAPAPCRSHQYMVELFERSGLQLMHTALQKGFPKGLFKVRMYALKPKA